MRVTPLDIIQKQFTANRRGYEPDEVRGFREEIRETMEDLLKENQRLPEQIARFEAEIAELRSEEHEVKETLQLARQVKEEMERTARRESDVVLGEARLEAEKIIMAAGDEAKRFKQRSLASRPSEPSSLVSSAGSSRPTSACWMVSMLRRLQRNEAAQTRNRLGPSGRSSLPLYRFRWNG